MNMRGKSRHTMVAIALGAVAVSACRGSDASVADGELGGHCYLNETCNVGLICASDVCALVDANVSDAAIDAPQDAASADAPIDAALCSDDAALEPNNTTQTAFITDVDTAVSSRAYAGLAICPQTDIDHYQVNITAAGANLEMLVDYSPDGATLSGSILNGGGVGIAIASGVNGVPQRIRAYAPNLPGGTYYVKVSAPASGSNYYRLGLNVTGP